MMTDAAQAEAAMAAIEEALSAPPSAEETEMASLLAVARSDALNVVIEAFRGTEHHHEREDVIDALDTLASHYGHSVVPDASDVWDEDGPPILDGYEIDEALARAQRGQIEDCLVHLGRALPTDYAPIADALATHLRTDR